MQIKQHNDFLFYILALALPVLFTALWVFTNTQLPTSDATDYLNAGNNIYRHFTDNGFWHGLLHFDIPRGWRPIFFSVLTAPFLFLSRGNVFFAYQAVAISCVIASAIYVYLFSRLYLNRISAVITANLICLLPLLQQQVLTFLAECALFPAVMGSLYHLVQSDYFKHKKHSIGFIICFSLAMVIRPVEAITALIFVLMVFLATGWYRQLFSFKQIVSVTTVGLVTVFLLLLSVTLYFMHHFPFQPIDGGIYDAKLARSIYTVTYFSVIAMVLSLSGLLLMRNNTSKPINDPPIIFVFMSICVLVLLWFMPHAFQTYAWVYRTSLGDLADMSRVVNRPTALSLLYQHMQTEGLLVVVGVAVVALFSAMMIGFKKLREVCFSLPFIYVLLLIPFSVWEVLNTIQVSGRKLSVAFPALLLALLLIALQRGRTWLLRNAIVLGLLVAQFIFALSMIYPNVSALNAYASNMGYYPAPVRSYPNPHDVVLQFLNREVAEYHYKDVYGVIDAGLAMPVDPFLMSLLNRIHRNTYTFGYPYLAAYSDANMEKFNQPGKAIFITDKKKNMVISESAAHDYALRFQQETNANMKMHYRFLHYYSANKLAEIGWKLGHCMVVTGGDGEEYQGCLLTTATFK